MNHRSFIVLPAFNEARVIAQVISDIQQHGFPRLIVVDDGSTDGTAHIADRCGAYVLKHRLNRGKGAAIKTGMEAAKLLNAQIVVTMDADGQHQAKDIAVLINPIVERRCDVVLGTRQWGNADIPAQKALQNLAGNTMTWLMYRRWVTDSQSGFRAYSRTAMDLIDTEADFYDYDSEVIREIRTHSLRCVEVPISVRYTRYARTKPARQSLAGGIKTVARMLWQRVS
jgi:glycosyltransferase involved in cell wall biosynthesis